MKMMQIKRVSLPIGLLLTLLLGGCGAGIGSAIRLAETPAIVATESGFKAGFAGDEATIDAAIAAGTVTADGATIASAALQQRMQILGVARIAYDVTLRQMASAETNALIDRLRRETDTVYARVQAKLAAAGTRAAVTPLALFTNQPYVA